MRDQGLCSQIVRWSVELAKAPESSHENQLRRLTCSWNVGVLRLSRAGFLPLRVNCNGWETARFVHGTSVGSLPSPGVPCFGRIADFAGASTGSDAFSVRTVRREGKKKEEKKGTKEEKEKRIEETTS